MAASRVMGDEANGRSTRFSSILGGLSVDDIRYGAVTGFGLQALRESLDLEAEDVAVVLGIPLPELVRKERSGASLTRAEADRAFRIARIADLAVELMGDEEKAKRWMRTRHRSLGAETPIAQLDTEIGSENVRQALYAIAYGGVA